MLTPEQVSQARLGLGIRENNPVSAPSQMSGNDLANHYLSLDKNSTQNTTAQNTVPMDWGKVLSDTWKTYQEAPSKITEDLYVDPEKVNANKPTIFTNKTADVVTKNALQATSDVLNTIWAPFGAATKELTDTISKNIEKNPAIINSPIMGKVADFVQGASNQISSLAKKDPEATKALGNALNIVLNALSGEAGPLANGGVDEPIGSIKGILEGGGKAMEAVKNSVGSAKNDLQSTINKIPPLTVPVEGEGAMQMVRELGERIPRAFERGGEALKTAAKKAELIKNSTPEIADALKVNLDRGIIDTVKSSDKVTNRAFKDVIDIAETPAKGGIKKNPTIVGGDLASKQYDLISKEKDTIGEQLGNATKELSKTKKVSMKDSFNKIDKTLAETGIVPTVDEEKGVNLDFTGSKYTPAERTKIKELYQLATEGGDNLSPLQIREKDQLFSKLQREARMEGVGNLIIDTPEGSKSLFSIFRDIYSSKLDSVSPKIKTLNAKYSKLAKLTDDIEGSIIKTPNFNATKSVDSAEFAKVNLRRIFGESQSSPAFEAVADAMDKTARELGYKGATPKQVAQFAEQIRSLYPDIVPKTGFQGGIKTGVKGALDKVAGKIMESGAPNFKDQQKALRVLIESLAK